jgi:hypothetical protein
MNLKNRVINFCRHGFFKRSGKKIDALIEKRKNQEIRITQLVKTLNAFVSE